VEPRLSVCLPVYNFGAFIGATLDSILPQVQDGVEILVVDGASTDQTQQVVEARARSRPQLRYVRLARRGGIDADMAAAIELARGEYCWMFSGDDFMRPGAVARALAAVSSAEDIYLCKHTNCDRDMRFLHEYPVFASDTVRTVDLADPAARAAYLEAAVTTEALFSFMGGLVIRRDKWRSEPPVERFMGSCWGHVARLLAASRRGLRVRYVAEVWLDKRGDNDSFMDRGIVYRLGIAARFVDIAAHFFGAGSSETAQVRRLLRREMPLPMLFFARRRTEEAPQTESRLELDRIAAAVYDSGVSAWAVRALYRGFPLPLYLALRGGYLAITSITGRGKTSLPPARR
jgi:abequosyltransferase